MATKNVALQTKINGILTDIMVKTGADNVVVDSSTGELLSARLAQIATDISNVVAGGVTSSQVDAKVSAAIDALIAGAPGTYDTLKEIADYIAAHEETATAINAAIGNKVDKVAGKGLSTNDFTAALKTKLEGIAAGATKVEAGANGKIKINGVETAVYTHPAGGHVRAGTAAPADLAEGELFIKYEA